MSNLYFDTDFLSLLPEWYREVLEYQQIVGVEKTIFEQLQAEIEAVNANMYTKTMDLGTVEAWEKVFGILASPSTETLDFRRARILNRLATTPPYTIRFLENKLDELIGPDQWKVTMDYPNYTLYVESSARNQAYAGEVAVTIGRIKPAHIVYINRPFMSDGVLVSETINRAAWEWRFILGSYGLGTKPFGEYVTRGVIKMPTTPSVSPGYLNDIATFSSSEVASARINGTVVISDLTKTVSGSVLTVLYTVTPAQATEINTIELLDSNGDTLTSTTVYVPVGDETQLQHIIQIAEGVVNDA